MAYNFDEDISIKGMNSQKWEFMKRLDSRVTEKTIPFWLADMDFACCPDILDAIKARAEKRLITYARTESEGYMTALKTWYKEFFDWDIQAETAVYSQGIVIALAAFVNALTKPGEGVIIQKPVYPPFIRVVEKNDRKLINNALIKREDGSYEMDFEDLEEKCKQAKMIILCSPHNPVGRVWSKEELEKLGEICIRNNVFIVTDEIHMDLTRTNIKHYPLETLFPNNRDMIATCISLSKSFNIAGLSQAHVIIPCPEIREKWLAAASAAGMNSPNPLSVAAAEAAFIHGRQWLKEVKQYLDENMDFMEDYIGKNMPKVGFKKPEGSYLTWLDFSEYGNSDEIFSLFLEKGDMMLQRGTEFGKEEGEGYLRFNAAVSRKNLEEALSRMSKLIKQV